MTHRTFATNLLRNHAGVDDVMDALEHRDPTSVMKYLLLDDERSRKCGLSLDSTEIPMETWHEDQWISILKLFCTVHGNVYTGKTGCGFYIYESEECKLKHFDTFCMEESVTGPRLSSALIKKWGTLRDGETLATYSAKTSVIWQFALFLVFPGIEAYIPSDFYKAEKRWYISCQMLKSRHSAKRLIVTLQQSA